MAKPSKGDAAGDAPFHQMESSAVGTGKLRARQVKCYPDPFLCWDVSVITSQKTEIRHLKGLTGNVWLVLKKRIRERVKKRNWAAT